MKSTNQYTLRIRGPINNCERELFELNRQINTNNPDLVRQIERHRSEIQDPHHPGFNQPDCDFLSRRSGNRNHAQPNALPTGNISQGIDVVNRDPFDLNARSTLVSIKSRDDSKALAAESTVPQQSSPEVSDTNDCDRPILIGAQNLLDRFNQFSTAISDSGITKLSKIGEIFSNLSIGESQQRTQLGGADGFLAFLLNLLQFAQIETQTTYDRLRY